MKVKFVLFISLLLLVSSCSKKGKSVPDFSLTSLNGDEIRLKDLRGKIVVINVWATWCGTCVKEIPDLNSLVLKYQADPDVVFLAFNDEPEEKVIRFLQRWPFHFIHFADAKEYTGNLQSRLVKTYPQTIVLDPESVVVFDQSNGTDDIYTKIDLTIQALKNP